jgi:hypothetical protein
MSMFRSIGLSLLIMCAFALLQGATLFAGITNGDFSDGLNGWDYLRTSYLFENLEQATIEDMPFDRVDPNPSFLSQTFLIDPGYSVLQFEVFVPQLSETEYFSAFLTNPSGDVSQVPSDFWDSYFYRRSTSLSDTDFVDVANGVKAFDMGEGWMRISVPVTSLWQNVTLRFELTCLDPKDVAYAVVDNVALTAVPEPAAMTLGLIGVAAVGAVRRRMR